MGSYIRGFLKKSESFLEILDGACEVNKIFLEIFTLSPTILYHMIGYYKEGERGVFKFP